MTLSTVVFLLVLRTSPFRFRARIGRMRHPQRVPLCYFGSVFTRSCSFFHCVTHYNAREKRLRNKSIKTREMRVPLTRPHPQFQSAPPETAGPDGRKPGVRVLKAVSQRHQPPKEGGRGREIENFVAIRRPQIEKRSAIIAACKPYSDLSQNGLRATD